MASNVDDQGQGAECEKGTRKTAHDKGEFVDFGADETHLADDGEVFGTQAFKPDMLDFINRSDQVPALARIEQCDGFVVPARVL